MDYSKLELEIVDKDKDKPDGKSGEVLQTAVQTISSYKTTNSQQKVHLGQRPKNDGTNKCWLTVFETQNLLAGTICWFLYKIVKHSETDVNRELVQRLDVSITD